MTHFIRLKGHTGFMIAIGAMIALVTALGGGAAYGYFTSHGSGTGSSSITTMQSVTITATAGSPSTPLLPGLKGDISFNVKNNNSVGVSIVSVTSNGSITPDSGHSGCTTTDSNPVVALSVPSNLPYSITAVNGTSQSVDLSNAISMDVAATANCQGATFSVPVTITVHEG